MLLTISTTYQPATDLGFLLHKNPSRCQSFEMTFGKVHVFYPEASPERCTAALLMDVDPVALVRKRRDLSGAEGFSLEQYVNDRPYVASSFLSVAIAEVFGTALSGRCKDKPELTDQAIPLEARIPALPCRGGEMFLRSLFVPLGYEVIAEQLELDEKYPEWGPSRYFSVALKGELRLKDFLSHLYVLIPVLDDDKHYYVGDDEVEKLLRHASGWLSTHPAKEQIADRYLKHKTWLAREALKRLVQEESPEVDSTEEAHAVEEAMLEKKISLNEQRISSVVAVLKGVNARKVVDLGCGEGKLLRQLLQDRQFQEIVGMDVSYRSLELAAQRMHFERMPTVQRDRIKLIQGSLMYRDQRLSGFDAATLIEVIEHLDASRLANLERVLFEAARPQTVIVTTPNVEFNIKFENLPAGKLRHKDHRFEWTRNEFESWAGGVANRFGYTVRHLAIGAEDAIVGAPTQMGVFTRS